MGERQKFEVFAKIIHNIQTSYINQESKSKVDIGAAISSMKGEIRKMIGASIPEGSIDSMFNQLQGMSGILETNFSQLFSMVNEIREEIVTMKEEN
jgi:hypothetical protein